MSTRQYRFAVSSTGSLLSSAIPCPRRLAIVFFLAFALMGTWCTHAVAEDDLTSLSIEELMNVEVTSVSKTSERRSEAAAAIFVLSSEDIHRSGARTIPDLLRLVPGLDVAQISGNKWSVTSRGFGGRFANKLLVLIDGRSIYTPQFSGVLWEMHDIRIEDIDRIEVIRGPGGTLWGANAVNGVINITTKPTEDTQGGQVVVGGGNVERGFGSARYGGQAGDDLFYRAYIQAFERRPQGNSGLGVDADDDWSGGSVGFRLDWNATDRDTFMFTGGISDVKAREELNVAVPPPVLSTRATTNNTLQNRYVLGKWTRTLSDDSDFELQVYYDYYIHEQLLLDETQQTADMEFQHRFAAGEKHSIIWGGRVRFHEDDFINTPAVTYPNASRNDMLYSLFVQDTFSATDELKLIVGAKLEYNSFSGFEFQPNIRAAWTPDEKQTVWAAISRAVRSPSRSEQDLELLLSFDTTPVDFANVFAGDPALESEELTAFELGYRRSIGENVFIDIATFYNRYDNLRSLSLGEVTALPQLPGLPSVLIRPSNFADGYTYGMEVTADWKPKSWWQIRAAYWYLNVNIDAPPDFFAATEDDVPVNQAYINSRWNLAHNIEVDATLRYVDEIKAFAIDEYFELDARIAWRPKDNLELALIGRNLLDSAHFEAEDTTLDFIPSEVARSIYFMVTWEF